MAAMGQYFREILSAIRTIFIGAQIKTNHRAFWAVFHPLGNCYHPVIVKAKAVDDSTILGQAKQARSGIAALGLWGRRPYFQKAEPSARQWLNRLRVFVKADCPVAIRRFGTAAARTSSRGVWLWGQVPSEGPSKQPHAPVPDQGGAGQ